MTAQHDRSARRERQLAAALGTRRVRRARGERAPDVFAIELPTGVRVQGESKSRLAPLRTLARWLGQAAGYALPGTVPLVAVYAAGQPAGDALVCLRMDDFRRCVGLAPEPAQRALPLEAPRHLPRERAAQEGHGP